MRLPTLYKRNEDGSVQQWDIGVAEWGAEGHGMIRKVYGKVDGKLQTAEDLVTEGKNVGRANETTPVQQAEAEAKSQWEKKLKKGYAQSLGDAEAGKTDAIIQGGVKPMLAHKHAEQGHKIVYPAYAQPKLDGHRCIAIVGVENRVTLWSRERKPITGVPHVALAIEQMQLGAGTVLDGELYNHDYHDDFGSLSSLIRSATPKRGHEVVQYWIYDVVSDNQDQAYRIDQLSFLARRAESLGLRGTIVPVPTETVADEAEMVSVFGAYLAGNFEGLMIRNKAGRYKNGRSYDLQKVKVMQDAEFEVKDVRTGRGRMAGRAIFECWADEAKTATFTVKMEGALEDLRKYAEDKTLAVGRPLTVRYQNLSPDGIPRFPVGVRFREDV